MTRPDDDGTTLATAWVEHLRSGGTTPWPRWVRQAGAPSATATVGSAEVPGAAQLELLRRVNELGALPHRTDHVLSRPGPGRGPVHLRLPLEPHGPVAPRREVLRVAAGVLADLTAELPTTRARRQLRRPGRPRLPRPVDGLPAFVLEGPPVTAAEVRRRLAAAGMPEHRRRISWLGARADPGPEHVVVLVAPLDEALRQAWASRVQRGAGRAWPRFVTQWAGRGALPPSVAVDRTVEHWASRVGAGNVHLVTLHAADPDPAVQVAAVLGHSLPSAGEPSAGEPLVGEPAAARPGSAAGPAGEEPVWLPPALVDVLRRVNVVLPFVCPEADRPPRRTALVGLMSGADGRPDPADLPAAQRGWAEATANRLVDALEGSGCPVHGDLAALRTVGPPTNRRVGGAEILDAMVRMIHRVDAALAGGSGRGRSGR